MKIIPSKKLFWFLKDGVELDVSQPAVLEMYVQQVVSTGRTEDVKFLLSNLKNEEFKHAFSKIKRFLPWEVRTFWEDFFVNH